MVSWWGAIGSRLSIGLTAILIGLLGFEWWRGRNAGPRYFIWLSMLTLTVSQWIGIQTDPGNFILLYPALFFSLEMISGRWKLKANVFIVSLLAVITVGMWVLFLATLQKSYQPIQNSVMFFPLPMIVFALLYWVRWWVINAKKVDYSSHVLEI
jgi:hypothetical protein